MSEIYYFGSEKVAPSTAVMDFNDGILKRVLLGNESEEKEPVSPEQEKTNKFIEETGKKLHLDLNGTPLKSPKEEGQVNITPEKVEINFTSVKCGLRYAIFQDDYGKLYSCGYGNLGELGLGKDKTYTKVPTLIDGLEYKRVAKYSCGPNHVVACSTDNKIFSWGDGNYGKQGVSAPTAIFRPLILSFSKVNTTSLKIQEDGSPVKERHRKEVPSVDYRWVDVACGGDFSIFAAEQGAFALGRETNGRLGVGAIFEPTSIPLNISFFQKIKIMGIASGKGHSAAWDSEGYAYSWGDGSEGRLGHSIDKGFHMSKFEIVPKRIIALEKYRILLMSCGNSHTCALTNKGEILTWGKASSNNKGEKSNYKLLEYFSPRKLTVNSSGDSKTPEPAFIKVVCGPTHNAAIDKDFKLYTWGDSSENCLGYPSDEDVLFPSLVKRLGDTKIIDVGCGDNFTFVIGCNQHKNLPSKALRSFQEGYLEHMKNTIQNIQEWRKRKAQSEFKLSTIQTPKPNITLPTHPDSPHTSVHEGGAKNTNFAATSNSSFFRGLSPSNLQLLDKVTTPKKFTRTAGSGSKLPFIMEASQKVAGIIDASSKNPRSPTLPHLARQHNHSTQHNMLSEVLMSEPAKSPTSPAINSPKFKLAIPDEIKKSPDNATFKNLDSVRSAFLPILFSPADENVRAQATEPDDYESLFGKKAVVDDYDVYSEVNENKIKDMMAKQAEQKVQANNTKVAKALYDEIDTHDDQLKFEYIQMVKSGKEQEHMLYLLTDPEGSNAYSETSLKHEKMKMKHQQEIQQDHLRTRHLIDSVKKTKESLVDRALPMTSDLIHQITGVYKYTKNFLEERVEARKLVPDDANRQPVVVVTNEDIVKRAVENRQRTMKVLHKKKEIEVARKQYLQEKFNKRTDEYKEALRLEKIEKVRKAECVKEMSSYFMFETMLNLIRVAAERGLQIKRQLFRYSMKARLIQSTYKKHAIIKKLKRLTPEQKANLVRMVRNYLMNKKVRKIVLLHLRLKLEFKIRTNLLLFKTKMANIFTFLQWTHKKMEAYRYKLALEWDNQIINNFKLKADAPISTDSPLVIIKYKSAESLNLKSGDSSPSREIQTNQIEEFISRSNRNFIKFLTLQNEGALKAPITLHPSILPTTYELNVGIKFEADNSNNTKPTKKSKNDDKKVVKEAERVEQKIKTFNNMLLPFSYHYCKALSIQYRINHETSSPFKDFIFERSVEFEAHLKYDFMNRILKECLRRYDEELKEYRKKLIKFKSDSNAEINLYRTMKMLNTPVDRLKALQKKEEYQMKRRTESISGNKAGNRFRNTEPENYQRDHLPFGTMLLKIAAVMPKAPKRPSLVVALKPNEFNVYFSKYYEAFKQKYTQMVMEEREKLFKRKV